MNEAKGKRVRARRRARSVRGKMHANPNKPRLSVFRSNKHISAQVIDDLRGHTIAAASSLSSDIRATGKKGVEVASLVGKAIGDRAGQAGVESCVFDRGCFRYAGRVKALAESAREAGLKL